MSPDLAHIPRSRLCTSTAAIGGSSDVRSSRQKVLTQDGPGPLGELRRSMAPAAAASWVSSSFVRSFEVGALRPGEVN